MLEYLPQQQKRSLGCCSEVLFELVSCLVPANFISYQSCLYAPVLLGNKVSQITQKAGGRVSVSLGLRHEATAEIQKTAAPQMAS